jgi:hypothetical protein
VIGEFDAAAYDALDAIVHDALTDLPKFSVAITCSGESGDRWSDL